MKLSTRGQYGLKAMLVFAENYEGDKPIPLREISEKQDIPENYLEQIVISLKKSNLLKSVRGARGGYYLSRSPQDISVGEILRAVEGDLAPTDCVSQEGFCEKEKDCATHLVWRKIYTSISDAVDNMSLQDIIHHM